MNSSSKLDENERALPIDRGFPLIGHTIALIKDPVNWGKKMHTKHGEAFIANAFFQETVFLQGADALEWLWMDKTESFSAERAYKNFFGHVTNTSLLLKDFTEHRIHRQALNPSFKSSMMQMYVGHMNDAISARVKEWRDKAFFKFYPAIKHLTLDVATEVFLGQDNDYDRQKINQALTDILASSLALIRLPIPGTKYNKAMRAKAYLDAVLRRQIASKRTSNASDVFTRLCSTKNAEGQYSFTENEILGHLVTFWVAGHDTLASSLTTLIYHLSANPEWQEKLRVEITAFNLAKAKPQTSDYNELTLCGYAFDEALRLMSPALHTPRVTLKDVSYKGFHIPKDSSISVGLHNIHHDPAHWKDPETFNPDRFSPEQKPVNQHKYAWSPFGGGPHKCIGLIFAQIQAKIFLLHFLSSYQICLADDYELKMQMLPTPRPNDGLPITLKPI